MGVYQCIPVYSVRVWVCISVPIMGVYQCTQLKHHCVPNGVCILRLVRLGVYHCTHSCVYTQASVPVWACIRVPI
jgi:hypothetical protein